MPVPTKSRFPELLQVNVPRGTLAALDQLFALERHAVGFHTARAENSQVTAMPGHGRPFQKGRSGNPGGRPKLLAGLQECARQYTMAAIDTLAAVMSNEKAAPAARIAAANALLDRGYGKPSQAIINATGNDKSHATDWTRDELVAVLRERGYGDVRAAPENGRGDEPDSVD